MANLCIIPARGGSKRIPRKNIRNFLGKPIISYSIEAAIKSELFDEIMVSSDDEEIIEIAKKFGAKAPFKRSQKNSNDRATTADVVNEVIEGYHKKGKLFSHICCLYPTAPLVNVQRLRQAFEHLADGKFESVFPVIPFDFPIWRGLKINEMDRSDFIFPEFALSRSQDLKPAFHDAGQFYWLEVNGFLKSGTILSKNTGSILLSKLESQDIDDLEDWRLAELKYELLQGLK